MELVDWYIPAIYKNDSSDYAKAKLLTLIGFIAILWEACSSRISETRSLESS